MTSSNSVKITDLTMLVNTGEVTTSSPQKEAKPNSVIDSGAPKVEKRKLTPEQEAFIRAKGLDPNNISDMELTNCLNEFYQTHPASNPDGDVVSAANTEAAPQKASSAGNVQPAATETSSTVVNTTVTTDAAQTANQASANTPVKSTNSAPATEAKAASPAGTQNVEIESDLTSEGFKSFHIKANKDGQEVFDWDFDETGENAKLTEKEKENFFVNSLAKYEYAKTKFESMSPEEQQAYLKAKGWAQTAKKNSKEFLYANMLPKLAEEEWSKLSPEEQNARAQAMEEKLASEIPNWGKMIPEDRVSLARAFLLNGSYLSFRDNNQDINKSDNLNTQINKVIDYIVTVRTKKEQKVQENVEFNNDVLDFVKKEYSDFKGEDLNDYKDGTYVDEMRYNYIKAKIAQNNGDRSCLTQIEQDHLETYESIRDKGLSLRELGTYSRDHESSTFAVMKKDKGYQDKFNEVYKNNLYDVNDDIETKKLAHKLATKAYLQEKLRSVATFENGQFYDAQTGAPLSQEDAITMYQKVFSGMMDNCEYLPEKLLLLDLAYEFQNQNPGAGDISTVDSESDANIEIIGASDSRNPKRQNCVLEKITHAVGKDIIKAKPLTKLVLQPRIFNEMPADKVVATALEANNAEVTKAYITTLEQGNLTDEEAEKVGNGLIENKEGKYSLETRTTYAANLHVVNKGIRDQQVEKTLKTGEVDMIDAFGSSIHKHTKEDQAKYFPKTVDAAKNLSNKEDSIRVGKTLANEIPLLHKDVQLPAHEEIMTFQYEEVLEQAINNISKYDSSIQQEAIEIAIEFAKETGNERLLDAATRVSNEIAANESVSNSSSSSSSSNSGVQNSSSIQQVIAETEAKYTQQIVSDVADAVIEHNLDASNPDVANMTQEERRKYYSEKFSNVKDLSAFIDRLSDGNKKEAYIKIAMYCPNLLKSIAANHGSAILKIPGLPLQVINIVAIAMLNSGGEAKKEGAKFILKSNFFSANIEKIAREAIYGDEQKQQKDLAARSEIPAYEQMYATMPQIISPKAMKAIFASNFNDIDYRRFYKDMPPIKG